MSSVSSLTAIVSFDLFDVEDQLSFLDEFFACDESLLYLGSYGAIALNGIPTTIDTNLPHGAGIDLLLQQAVHTHEIRAGTSHRKPGSVCLSFKDTLLIEKHMGATCRMRHNRRTIRSCESSRPIRHAERLVKGGIEP